MRREKEGREGRKGGGTRVPHERPCSHTTPPAEPPSCCQPGIDPTDVPLVYQESIPRFTPVSFRRLAFPDPRSTPLRPFLRGEFHEEKGIKIFRSKNWTATFLYFILFLNYETRGC